MSSLLHVGLIGSFDNSRPANFGPYHRPDLRLINTQRVVEENYRVDIFKTDQISPRSV